MASSIAASTSIRNGASCAHIHAHVRIIGTLPPKFLSRTIIVPSETVLSIGSGIRPDHFIKGEKIPLCGRIVALADVYDALRSKRVYKPAYSHQTARSLIIEGRSTQFDPDVVEAFLNRENEFMAVADQLQDDPHASMRLNSQEAPSSSGPFPAVRFTSASRNPVVASV